MKRILLSFALLFSALPLKAGELDPKMELIAAQFARDAAAKSITASAVAAVFPYSCDEKLTKKRVDLAISELLSARLIKNGTFLLVERAQLETVMKEQKLGLSGAIESATAAQVGKLAGARLAILGTVARVGRSYQISSKLVDTGSAEIISASIVEVPIAVFDEEAARYLVLVPEREALGIYVGGGGWPIKSQAGGPTTIPGAAGAQLTPKAKSDFAHSITLGLRYQMTADWLLDIAYAPTMSLGQLVSFTVPGTRVRSGYLNGNGGKLSVNRTANLSPRLRSLYGLGYQAFCLKFPYSGEPNLRVPGSAATDLKYPSATTFYSAFVRGGIEWRLKERLGWSLLGQLTQQKTITYDLGTIVSGVPGSDLHVMKVTTPLFTVDTSLTLYF